MAKDVLMMNETADLGSSDASADRHDQQTKQSRQQSTIQFPYGDLDSAVEVATALFENAAGGPCTQDQLVAYLGHTEASGTFRQKVSTAKIFSLIEGAGVGEVRLTDLGFRVVDRTQERQARAEAFLSVELYRKLFEDFKGRMLPPRPAPLERTFENYGVAPKQKDKARQAFERSAQQAGFFDHGRDRLVMPSGATTAERGEPKKTAPTGDGGDRQDTEIRGLDPLIQGLLKRMPSPPGAWPVSDRARWLQTLAMNLSFIYGDKIDDDIIEVNVRKREASHS
jgi:hypothetical protein